MIKDFFLEINSSSKHKKITKSENVYIIGGLLYLISIFFLELKLSTQIFFTTIYIFGFMADKNIIKSASMRLIIQILIIFLLIFFSQVTISETRIIILDNLIAHDIPNYLFTLFCILILINGSNFIDGINLNLIGYYLIINLVLLILFYNQEIDLNFYNLKISIFFLLMIFILNSSGKVISGDSGAYLISLNFGLILIDFSNNNNFISPFFIVLLLWYPAFENFFSIVRKTQLSKSALKPDFAHLHQLIYLVIIKKYKKKLISNNLSGFFINLYNFLIFMIGLKFISNTQTLIILVLINIIIYLIIYFRILKSISKKTFTY